MRNKSHLIFHLILSGCIVQFALPNGRGQASAPAENPPNPASGTSLSGEIVKMNEFEVDTTQDTGYLAKNTLSATRTSASLMDIPSNIQIVSGEFLQDLSANTMLPAVEFMSGGIDRRSFNPGDDQFIWGFRSSSTLKDGFPFGSNAVGNLYDVDRVEVIKGPAAMIFGQVAFTGGIINYVSRQPTPTFHAELDATYGSFDYRELAAHLSGPITRAIEYRLDAGTTQSNYSDRSFGYYHDSFVGGAVRFNLSDTTKLLIDGSYGVENYLYPQTVMNPLTGNLWPSKTFTLDQPWSTYATDQERVTVTLESRLGAGIQSRTWIGYNNSNNTWLRPFADDLQSNNVILDMTAEDYLTSAHLVEFQEDLAKDVVTGPVTQKFSAGSDIRWDVSAYIEDSFAMNPLSIVSPVYGGLASNVPGSGIAGYVINQYSWDTITSAYLQDEIKLLGDRVSLIGGGRFNGFESASGAPPAPGQTLGAISNNKTVDRYGILVHPVDNTTLYASHSESFVFNNGTTYPIVHQLVPSVGNDNEIGGKAELFNGQLMLQATYFHLKFTNVRIAESIPGEGSQAYQNGAQTNSGVDLGAVLSKKFDNVELDGSATFYHGNIRDQFGNTPVYPVNNTWSLFGTAKFKVGPASTLGVGGGVRFEGARVGPTFGAPYTLPDIWPAYTEGDALAYWAWKHVRVQLNVENVTNKLYIEGGEGAFWVYTNPGRVTKVSVSYQY